MPDEDSLRHKYDPLPEDAPRHRRRSKKKHVRSDHRHEYEEVCIDSYTITDDGGYDTYHLGIRCKVCGRLKDIKLWQFKNKPPDDLPLYRVSGFLKLLKMKVLPDEMRVEVDE